jgi:hypothetical protein
LEYDEVYEAVENTMLKYYEPPANSGWFFYFINHKCGKKLGKKDFKGIGELIYFACMHK